MSERTYIIIVTVMTMLIVAGIMMKFKDSIILTVAALFFVIVIAFTITRFNVTLYRQEDYDIANIDAKADYDHVYEIKRSMADIETDGDYYIELKQYFFGIEAVNKYVIIDDEQQCSGLKPTTFIKQAIDEKIERDKPILI